MPSSHMRHSKSSAPSLLFCVLCLFSASASHAETVQYTLQKGDTLWRLSERLLGSTAQVDQLQHGNRVKRPRLLRPGAVIQFPRSMLASDRAPITATSVTGDVSLFRESRAPAALRTGADIKTGDRIDTAAGAQVLLNFFDGSRLQLHESSSLRISRGESFGGGRIRHIEVELDRGSSEYHIAPQPDPNRRFEIITPAATTSVRGTRFRVSVNGDGRMQEEVLKGETLVHNELGKQSIEKGQGIAVTPGEAPSEVVTLLPAVDLSSLPNHIDGAQVELSWPPLNGAQQYQLQLAEDTDFTQLLLDQRNATPALKYRAASDARLYLRVAGIDAQGFVGLPATHELRLSWKPAAPQLDMPTVQTVFPAGTSVQWPAVANADRYLLQLATDPAFEQSVRQYELDQPRGELGAALLPGRYYWRVSAESAGGRASESSQTATLIVKGPQPPTPAPFELHDLIVLRWATMQSVESYELDLRGVDDDATVIADTQTEKTIAALPLPKPGDYRIRLRAIYANDQAGPWSEPTEMTVRRRPYEYLLLPLVLGM